MLQLPAQALSGSITTTFIAQCALFVGVLFVGTVIVGEIMHRLFKVPAIAGQILAGIVFGPSCFNIAQWAVFSDPVSITWAQASLAVSPADLASFFVIVISSLFTVSYLLWIAGHETDLREMARVGVAAITGGIAGALMPIGMIVLAAYCGVFGDMSLMSASGLGLIFAATSVSIPVAMLVSYQKMHLKSSKATLGAAIVDDIFAVILLSIFFVIIAQSGAHAASGHHSNGILSAVFSMVGVMALLVVGGRLVIVPVMQRLQSYQMGYLYAPLAHGIMLLYFAGAELIGGLAGITGAYFAGMVHAQADERHTAIKQLSPFVQGVLLPLFLGSIGLQVDVTVLSGSSWCIVGVLLAIAIVSKLIGCYSATWCARIWSGDTWTTAETYVFGASMIARGEVGLVVATIIRNANIISDEMYVVAVVTIVLTTVATPLLVAQGFVWLDSDRIDTAEREYAIKIGPFPALGTTQVFNIIVGHLERKNNRPYEIQLTDGQKVVDVEELGLKMFLAPSEHIMFEGNKGHINELLKEIRHVLHNELTAIKID